MIQKEVKDSDDAYTAAVIVNNTTYVDDANYTKEYHIVVKNSAYTTVVTASGSPSYEDYE